MATVAAIGPQRQWKPVITPEVFGDSGGALDSRLVFCIGRRYPGWPNGIAVNEKPQAPDDLRVGRRIFDVVDEVAGRSCPNLGCDCVRREVNSLGAPAKACRGLGCLGDLGDVENTRDGATTQDVKRSDLEAVIA